MKYNFVKICIPLMMFLNKTFLYSKRDKNMLALCTSKEIIEMDIKNLLAKNVTIDDECEMDILAMQK
jgi:hypothetical protein